MKEYFDTMKKFLQTQEAVMSRYLDGGRKTGPAELRGSHLQTERLRNPPAS
jgi:hypothetical protein